MTEQTPIIKIDATSSGFQYFLSKPTMELRWLGTNPVSRKLQQAWLVETFHKNGNITLQKQWQDVEVINESEVGLSE